MPDHAASKRNDSDLQEQVFLLMRTRLEQLFGPGGSFRIELARPAADEALFTSTVAQTIAWDVARTLDVPATVPSRRHASGDDETEAFWSHVQAELTRLRALEASGVPTADEAHRIA